MTNEKQGSTNSMNTPNQGKQNNDPALQTGPRTGSAERDSTKAGEPRRDGNPGSGRQEQGGSRESGNPGAAERDGASRSKSPERDRPESDAGNTSGGKNDA